jgi:lipoprotein NlpD
MSMSCFVKGWFILIGLSVLCSCGQREGLAPVVELNWRAANTNAKQHEVLRGETLYAIAFRYDQDYRNLAVINHLNSPYTLRVGQVVRFQPAAVSAKTSYYSRSKPIKQAKSVWHVARPTMATRSRPQYIRQQYSSWSWPVRGRVVAAYSPQQGKKGIDIAGSKGEKIHAANGGVVAYAGSGLSGYGNLIIIKHDNQYLTAYGNNLRNLVREGQHIQAGQAIAEIGVVDRRYWGVHFEIRKAGKPVNPLNYLQNG